MKKSYVDVAMAIHINNGIVHIIFGNDHLEDRFYKEKLDYEKKQIIPTNIISMPVSGFVESLSMFEQFFKESRNQEIFSKYLKIGILDEFENEND